HFGTQIKFIQSNYGPFRSNGVAMDVGVRYLTPNGLSQWSILLQNVGTQLKYFQVKEELPLNLILGWSKKLANAPLQFSVTAERLSVWNDNYYDIDFYNVEGYQKPGSLQNVFNHLIVGSQLYIGQSFEIDLGYHFARRFELNIPNQPNSLNGMSAGFSFPYKRVQFQYGTGFFQRNNYHHFTLQYALRPKD
ncbi:MAG: type secretion system protein PorQ, partial [Bacteroidota bacterium]